MIDNATSTRVIGAVVEPGSEPLETLARRIGSHYIRDGLQ